MAALLLLLFSAGVLLSSIEAQEAYSKLPDKYRKGVDLALQQLNSHSGVQHHFLFFKSLLKSDIEVKSGAMNHAFIRLYLVHDESKDKQNHGNFRYWEVVFLRNVAEPFCVELSGKCLWFSLQCFIQCFFSSSSLDLT